MLSLIGSKVPWLGENNEEGAPTCFKSPKKPPKQNVWTKVNLLPHVESYSVANVIVTSIVMGMFHDALN